MLGWLDKHTSPWRRFARLLPLLYSVRNEPELRRILRSYVSNTPLCLFSEPLRWLRMVLVARRRHPRSLQKPRSFFATELPAQPFWPPDDFSRRLEANIGQIRAEFEQLTRVVPSPSKRLLSSGDWTTFPLVRNGREHPDYIERCPKTWEIAQSGPLPAGVRGGIYFSMLDPGTHIEPHCGPSNLKHRYHLTVVPSAGARIRAGDEWRTWEEGHCLILDDSFEHEVFHEGDARRVVLIVDCWHRDLSPREREFLIELYQRIPERSKHQAGAAPS